VTPLVSLFTAVSKYALITVTGGRPSRLNVHIGMGSSYSNIQAHVHANNSLGVTSTPADFETTFGDEVDLSSPTDTTLSLSNDEQHPQAGLSGASVMSARSRADVNSSSETLEEGNNAGSSSAPVSGPTAAVAPPPTPAPVVTPPPVVVPTPVTVPAPIIAAAPSPVVTAPPVVATHIPIAPAIPPAPVAASTSASVPINPNAINSTPAGPEDGNWYAITVGCRVGVFNDWCVARIPMKADESAGCLLY
jgi:hypothetical protein